MTERECTLIYNCKNKVEIATPSSGRLAITERFESFSVIILFITILLGLIISLAGCGWFPNGLFGIIDPPAIIKVDYTLVNLGEGSISLEIYSMNEVGFNASGFSYEYYYYSGTTKIPIFTKVVEANFYVEK